MKLSAILLLCAASALADAVDIPFGAATANCTKLLFDERPTVSDIKANTARDAKWFSGQWYAKRPPSLDHYSMTNNVLTLEARADGTYGDLCSVPRAWPEQGLLPLLPGKTGFYVEFEVSLSDNDSDHFPAVWLMPENKRAGKMIVQPGDPAAYERWMELDVDEGGFGPGWTCTVHNWFGKWPEYHHIQNPNNVSKQPLDRTVPHRFGAAYLPKVQTVVWWVDDKRVLTATAPYVPEIGERSNYYLIMGAQMRSKKIPYKMFIHRVRAFVPQD